MEILKVVAKLQLIELLQTTFVMRFVMTFVIICNFSNLGLGLDIRVLDLGLGLEHLSLGLVFVVLTTRLEAS